MVPEDTQWLQADGMSDAQLDAFLREHGTGTLALADEGRGYGVPISFGYDGDACFFVFLQLGPESKKVAFAEVTTEATLTVVETAGTHDWASAVVTGPVAELGDDEWARARDAIADNGWYPSLFSESTPQRDVLGYRLDVEHASGQMGSEYEA